MSKQRNRQRKTKLDAQISAAHQQPTQLRAAVIAEDSPLIDPPRVAALLGVTENTLAIWRATKRYPLDYTKIGRLVRYKKTSVMEFIESRMRSGSSAA